MDQYIPEVKKEEDIKIEEEDAESSVIISNNSLAPQYQTLMWMENKNNESQESEVKMDQVKEENEIKIEEEELPQIDGPVILCQEGPSWKEDRNEMRVKREHAQVKRECQKTGGGPPPPTLGDESQKVLAILGTEVNDLGCEFNSNVPRLNNMVIVQESEVHLIPEEEEVQHVAAAIPTSASITPDALPSENVLADVPLWPETSGPKQLVSKGAEGAVNSQPANIPAASVAPPRRRPVCKGAESVARDCRHRRFETSFAALAEGTLWRKEMFSQQQELIEMQKQTEALRQELLRAQVTKAQTRARIALLEEEALKKELDK